MTFHAEHEESREALEGGLTNELLALFCPDAGADETDKARDFVRRVLEFGQRTRYPGVVRSDIVETAVANTIGTDNGRGPMLPRLAMAKAAEEAVKLYQRRMGIAPSKDYDVQTDTYPGILDRLGVDPMAVTLTYGEDGESVIIQVKEPVIRS